MGYRRILAAAAAFAMMATAFSCGKEDKKASEVTDSGIVTEDTTESGSADTTKSKDKSDKKEDKTTTAKEKDKSGKDTTTTKADSKSTSAATTDTKNGSSGGSSSGGNSSGGNSSGDSSSSGGGNSSGDSSSSGGGSSEGSSGEEVKEYTAEVTLGSSTTVKGSNVTVNGSVITVTGAGDFIFSGTLSNGQIVVKTGAAATEDKVTIVLNGVDINNTSGPAIFIDEAKRCTVKPKEGSVNYISSDVEKKGNTDTGAIFSNDTIRLKGNGELNITATASHGINSDDDVIIESGTYNINSRKSGIIANDDITINEGTISIKAGTNGIKSKGTLNVNGGYTEISGGTKEEKSSIFAARSFSYKKGYLYAAGNKVTPPTYSDNPFVVVDLGDSYDAGTTAEIFLNGGRVVSMEPHNNFRCLLVLSPDIANGSSFYTVVGGERSDDFTVGSGMNEFKVK
ncbi:MAG: carbohydrate-binding domain-containing protein [Ruminococcus sp.]|nr:carbohydrate-binding domain-containing protein [Ruminococcus sp.]